VRARSLPLLALAFLAAPVSLSWAAPPIDPFYLDLLREGERAMARGDARQAARDLRLACFGMLDEPPALAGCLGRLLLAEQAAGGGDEATATAARLVEVEERFEGLSRSDLAADQKAAIVERLSALLPAETLSRAPAFAAALARRRADRLDSLPERERVRELERLAAAEPAEPRWRIELATLDLDRGRAAEGLARLEGLPATGRVPCLRGEALAALDRCAAALPALAACDERASALRFARPRLACLLAAGELEEATGVLDSLPASLRDDPALRRLRRDLEREQRRAAPATAPEPVAKPQEAEPARRETATPAPPPAAAPPEPRPPVAVPPVSSLVPAVASPRSPAQALAPAPAALPTPEERAQLDALALQLSGARRAGELTAALAEAKALADRRPELLEAQRLAGEIAYRASRWGEAATYLGRARLDPATRPELLFYLAVARFESGDRAGARTALEAVGPRLAPSPFVDRYRQRILAP